jgi:magnesium chelatase family protein
VPGVEVEGVASLGAAVDLLRRRRVGRRLVASRVDFAPADEPSLSTGTDQSVAMSDGPDLAEVRGQLEARRALEIALAGGHAMLMIGPPGSGKTLLARTIPPLLPPLDDAGALAATVIASAAGEGPVTELRRAAPVRSPHHTLSYAAMVGGGPRMSPGEVTLASDGVLFLDELPEFGRDVLEALRQPLEDGFVSIARVGRAMRFPARVLLVAAMNPCPCGWAGDPSNRCRCPLPVVDRYANRVSGPLRDRIDLWVAMGRVPPEALVAGREPESSAVVAPRIARARAVQIARQGVLNARMSGRRLRAACALDRPSVARAVELADLEGLTGRGTERLLRVGRTIADLAGAPAVRPEHLDEAARFRSLASRVAAREAS